MLRDQFCPFRAFWGLRSQNWESMSSPKEGSVDTISELEGSVLQISRKANNILGLSEREEGEEVPARQFKVPYVVRAGGAVLTMCAGIVNVTAFLHLDSFVSHTTGTLAKVGMGLQLDNGQFDPGALILMIASFMAGSLTCGLFIGKNKVHFGLALYDFGLLSVCFLTILTFLTAETGVAKYLSAAACGLQNGLCTEWGGAAIRTTHVTGLFTDTGLLIGRMLSMLARKGCGKKFDVIDCGLFADDKAKLSVLTILGFSYFFGAYMGAVLYNSMQAAAFLVPAAITGTMGTAYLFYRVKILHHRLFSDEEMEIVNVQCDVVLDAVLPHSPPSRPSGGFIIEGMIEPASPRASKTDHSHALERSLRARANSEESVAAVSRADVLSYCSQLPGAPLEQGS
mmetsp:Transcript_38606/g.69666  ORF Transcript_38606/g.69666 Transcript_38606/m.69666 type:complete len:398 (+) Transcript_38606:3-1196(+)